MTDAMLDKAFAKRLFAADWYATIHPEAAADPFRHFWKVGIAAGFEPNPLFDSAWYGARYRDALRRNEPPFENYLREGARLGRDPGPLFDTQWYLARNPDVGAAGVDPFEHYLLHGSRENRDPSPVFDTGWYFTAHPEAVRLPGLDARAHYMEQGHKLGYSPNPLFDTQWYRASYPEVAASGENPLLHYLRLGADQGLNPGPHFDTATYVEHHPACIEERKNPLVYFLLDEEMRRQAARDHGREEFLRPSDEAVEEIDALVGLLGEIEVELAELEGRTEDMPVHKSDMDDVERVWRGLYLSLFAVPRRIVFVGSIEETPELLALAIASPDLLIVETDAQSPSRAEGLPHETQWLSLSEFGYLPEPARRAIVITALVNNLQPEAVLVWGSQAGWEMLVAHGRALREKSRLFAVATSVVQKGIPDPLKLHFASAIAVLSALYGSPAYPVEHFGLQYGLPPSETRKLQNLGEWSRPGGFLEPEASA